MYSILASLHTHGIVQTVLQPFLSLYVLNALQSDNNSYTVYVLGYKVLRSRPSQSYFTSCLVPQAKMTLSLAKNIFLPTNTNYIDSKYHNV